MTYLSLLRYTGADPTLPFVIRGLLIDMAACARVVVGLYPVV